jgi:hypothetical protein
MHLLLFIQNESELDFTTPAYIDEVVCAKFLDPAWDPTGELTDLVTTMMIHSPCRDDNPNAPCMVRKSPSALLKCSKGFLKHWSSETKVTDDGYPIYRCRNDGRTFVKPRPGHPGEIVVFDNRSVVPYNPYLLKKYKAYINVEVCATVAAIKYINKYIYKGADQTTLAIENNCDETVQYTTG